MILNFKTQKQLQEHWCWAAVSSSISLFFDGNSMWQQNNIVGSVVHSSCSIMSNGNTPLCNVPGDAAIALQHTGNLAGQLQRPLLFNEILMQINAGYPICCQMHWSGLEDFHFVIIYGYQGTSLVIGDTESGVALWKYEDFLNNYREGGEWIRTIGVRKPAAASIN